MKILITTGIFPPDIGGPARIVERLAVDLVLRQYEVAILTFGRPQNQSCPYRLIRANGKRDFIKQLWRETGEADIIYTFDLYTAGFFSWLIGKVLRRKKLIIRFAGDSAWETSFSKTETFWDIAGFQEHKHGWGVELFKFARKRILCGADKVIAVSRFMGELAQKIGVDHNKIKVIYNSVDFVDISNLIAETKALKQNLGLENFRVIVTSGRLVLWKGIGGLVEAVARLRKDGLNDIKLVVVGEGPERRYFEIRAETALIRDSVLFVGKVPLDKVFAYYNLADVFVLNSLYEGLSHVLLEVLRLGKPIVASNCGGNPEVIENEKNGLLVEYNNVEQLRTAIKRVLTEKKWHTAEYQDNCRESLKKFNWQNVIEQTIKVFNDAQ